MEILGKNYFLAAQVYHNNPLANGKLARDQAEIDKQEIEKLGIFRDIIQQDFVLEDKWLKPEIIADFIIKCVENPEIKAIFFSGGRGMESIVDIIENKRKEGELSPEFLSKKGMFFLGMSDAEPISKYLADRGIGQQILTRGYEKIADLLAEGKVEKAEIFPLNQKAPAAKTIEGTIFGGSAISLWHSCFSYNRFEPYEETNILYLEDPKISAIERSLEILRDGGNLEKVQGIVLGKYSGRKEELDLTQASDQTRAMDLLNRITSDIPVFYGTRSGHGGIAREPIDIIPIACKSVITQQEDGRFFIEISPFRTRENIENTAHKYFSRENLSPGELNEKWRWIPNSPQPTPHEPSASATGIVQSEHGI